MEVFQNLLIIFIFMLILFDMQLHAFRIGKPREGEHFRGMLLLKLARKRIECVYGASRVLMGFLGT